MERELKNNISSIIDSIENSVKLQEYQLDNRYKVLDLYAENDEVKKLCNDFAVYTQNAEQEDFCQKILHDLLIEIKNEQDRKKMC
ncbi:MAG: hypothetical protein RSA80_01550 [Lachnospiraceae bacterium]